MTEIINVTPETIAIVDEDGRPRHTFEPSGLLVHVGKRCVPASTLEFDGDVIEVAKTYPVLQTSKRNLEGKRGRWYIVDREVALTYAAGGRSTFDLLLPNGPVYGPNGELIGYRRFCTIDCTMYIADADGFGVDSPID